MIKDLEESCEMSKSLEVDSLQQLCTQYSYQAYNFLSEISSNKEHVMKIIDQPKNSYRSKRGLINLVGRVANVLFGVCDDTDAEYFYSKIRDLESSNSRISKSSDAQIQIMQSIISNVNSSLLEINKNEINLADKYNFLLHEMQTEKAAIGTLNFKTALEERISLLNIILTQYAFETGNLLNIINMALQGFVHSSILDTNTFKSQLKDIKAQLPIGEGIPIDLDNSGISELLRLITTNIVYIENVLIFVIEIPLVNSYEFILYKNIPLPVNIYGNDYVMIAPKSDYIAIDKSRLYYLELSEIQISKCKQMMNMLLCTYDQQLHHLDESCELTVFRKPGILPNSCNLKNVNFNFSIWHRLDNTNSWIYVTIRDNIIIKCKNNSETIVVSINGTGILDLDNQCEANTDDGTLLIAKRKITTKMYKDFIPQLDTSINWKTKLDITNIILNNSIIPNKDLNDKNTILKPTNVMANNKQTILSLETAIKLVPQFNGENPQDVYPFFSACDFVIKTVDEECRPILLQAILTKLAGKAFAITQHREVKSWDSLRELLTVTFCAKRTPGYLQLELSTTRFKSGETIQEYSSRVEKLLHELCNVSTSKRTKTEAKAVHDYIKETTLTTYIEGLPDSIRNIIKSRNPSNLEDAMKVSLEEEKIFLSNKETRRLFQNKSNANSTNKYCKNCQKSNHNTNECRYANRSIDTGQNNKQKNSNTKQETCAYCKKSGHTIDKCYKKKGADERKNNQQEGDKGNQQNHSGNGSGPNASGSRPVKDLKIIAQTQ
ncbi:hypothetical protein QTP88_001174 [Uroleucon formosanum]